MTQYFCKACANAFPDSESPPETCPICEDDRQYVPQSGQEWLTQEELVASYSNIWKQHEPGLMELRTDPGLGIGQRAFLLQTPDGNILWDCISLLDEATEEIIHSLGGISHIAVSHPHFYGAMSDFSQAFDAPVHIHERDRQWVTRPDPRISFWDGDAFEFAKGMTLHRLGGHFAGGAVLNWAGGASGRGAMLCGDILQVSADEDRVSVMWSYANGLPLSAPTVRRIVTNLEPLTFDRLYGGFSGREILSDAKSAAIDSLRHYADLLETEQP